MLDLTDAPVFGEQAFFKIAGGFLAIETGDKAVVSLQAENVSDDVIGLRIREHKIRHHLVRTAQKDAQGEGCHYRIVGDILKRGRSVQRDAMLTLFDNVAGRANLLGKLFAFDGIARHGLREHSGTC